MVAAAPDFRCRGVSRCKGKMTLDNEDDGGGLGELKRLRTARFQPYYATAQDDFGEQFEMQKLSAWKEQYVDYKRLRGAWKQGLSSEKDCAEQLDANVAAQIARAREIVDHICVEKLELIEKIKQTAAGVLDADLSLTKLDSDTRIPSPFSHHQPDSASSKSLQREQSKALLRAQHERQGSIADYGATQKSSQQEVRSQVLVESRSLVTDASVHLENHPVDLFLEETNRVVSWYLKALKNLHAQLVSLMSQKSDGQTNGTGELEIAFVDLFRDVNLLDSFTELNLMALNEVLLGAIVMEKRLRGELGQRGRSCLASPNTENAPKIGVWLEEMQEGLHRISAHRSLVLLRHVVESVFANRFGYRSRMMARARLLMKRGQSQFSLRSAHDLHLVQLGVRFGVMLALTLWFLWDLFVDQILPAPPHDVFTDTDPDVEFVQFSQMGAFLLFRGFGCLLLVVWCWTLACFIWDEARVNYRFLLQLNPRAAPQPLQLLSEIINVTSIYLINAIMYFKIVAGRFPPGTHPAIFPVLLSAFIMFKLVWPWYRMRGLWYSLGQIVAIFYPLTFFHAILTDWWSSLVKPVTDLVLGSCYLMHVLQRHSGSLLDADVHKMCSSFQTAPRIHLVVVPAITVMPLFLRFCQCVHQRIQTGARFPAEYNATKYLLSMFTVGFGTYRTFHAFDHTAYRWLWLSVFELNSLYSFVWDIFVDWQLGAPAHGFLRKDLMYRSVGWYYAAMAMDIVGRHIWMLSLLPLSTLKVTLKSFGVKQELDFFSPSVIMCFEVLRRGMWSLLRIETEHISNLNGFRLFGFVPLYYGGETTDEEAAVETFKKDERQWLWVDLPTVLETFAIVFSVLYILCIVLFRNKP
ncbi:SPX and EXS domain-containing protein 1 [Porphyridium purpureum]|uniref:SPX and EXS domain-containing protein 1 n=1 Tax=Porphyridium purpureum TaxID=35688 RepID=A0A5J4Z499_PORPP|nr:SPX and EXS domain-containing protein 1 [Porphyridium purpureum]|eukprot:POR4141..scf295_1